VGAIRSTQYLAFYNSKSPSSKEFMACLRSDGCFMDCIEGLFSVAYRSFCTVSLSVWWKFNLLGKFAVEL
jgi:hypothetical protein